MDRAWACLRGQVFVVCQYARRALDTIEDLRTLGWQISITWCPSHCYIKGNERADTIAKRGANSPILHSWLCLMKLRVAIAAWLSMQMTTAIRGAVLVRRVLTASWTAWSSASYTSARLPRWQPSSLSRYSCWSPQWYIAHPHPVDPLSVLSVSRRWSRPSEGLSFCLRVLLARSEGLGLNFACVLE